MIRRRPNPRVAVASPPIDDPLDARAAMVDWDTRFMRWQHEQGLQAMRESDDPETRRLADTCNCIFCLPVPPIRVPGRGRVGFG